METVDTSRPFTSVKEAVALFGDRILSPPMPKQDPPWKSTPIDVDPNKTPKNGNPNSYDHHQHPSFMDTLKKIEAELQGIKTELKKLKERESETEVALATLNAELHKNMSRMAQAEANAAAAKAASFREGEGEGNRRSELILRMENSSLPTLGQVLNFGEKGGVFGERKIERERKKKKQKKKMKKKPIIPLVGDLFSWKKSSSANIHLQNDNNLYTSSYMYI